MIKKKHRLTPEQAATVATHYRLAGWVLSRWFRRLPRRYQEEAHGVAVEFLALAGCLWRDDGRSRFTTYAALAIRRGVSQWLGKKWAKQFDRELTGSVERRRRAGSESKSPLDDAASREPEPWQAAAAADTAAAVRSALRWLPSPVRSAVEGHDLAGDSLAESKVKHGCERSLFQTRVRVGRELLRRRLAATYPDGNV